MTEKGKIVKIEALNKPRMSQIDEAVAKISKDEFTTFRINKEKRALEKMYLRGKYLIDDTGNDVG